MSCGNDVTVSLLEGEALIALLLKHSHGKVEEI